MTRPRAGMAGSAARPISRSTVRTAFRVADETPGRTAACSTSLINIPSAGKKVHDANIVATMLAHGIRHLLTFNVADFRRFEAAHRDRAAAPRRRAAPPPADPERPPARGHAVPARRRADPGLRHHGPDQPRPRLVLHGGRLPRRWLAGWTAAFACARPRRAAHRPARAGGRTRGAARALRARPPIPGARHLRAGPVLQRRGPPAVRPGADLPRPAGSAARAGRAVRRPLPGLPAGDHRRRPRRGPVPLVADRLDPDRHVGAAPVPATARCRQPSAWTCASCSPSSSRSPPGSRRSPGPWPGRSSPCASAWARTS